MKITTGEVFIVSEKYSIVINAAKKVINMKVVGTFTPEDVQNFVKDYQAKVNSIEASAYTLDVDCTSMDILKPEMVPALENSFKMYKESGFGKVLFTINKSAILKMQLNRIVRNSGLTNAEVVEL